MNSQLDSDNDFLPNLCSSQAVLLLVLVAQLLAVLLALASSGLRHFSWELLGMISFHVQWVVLLSAALLCRARQLLNRLRPTHAGLISYGLVLGVTALVALSGQWLQYVYWPQPPVFSLWGVAEQLLIAVIVAGIGLRYLYLQQQLRNQQSAILSARIDALQARIRPHFLFNSMNSIASLIETAPETAERVVEDLSELFRASLAEPALVPLERELALARRYLAIEQLRLGERLKVDWQVPDLPKGVLVPSLLLQPLLENAVFHGIEPLPDGGAVVLKVGCDERQVHLAIHNPLPPDTSGTARAQRPHNHMALDNVRHRLEAHFGPQAGLAVEQHDNHYHVHISYPRQAYEDTGRR
ncbi:sensor histidine kinase [Marinimicrobium alkaliphilum]|uniref:sensor histidine kinase n=1 Tax=Marinimicrobium alkaliphilum TaxID=2202654 RepID=UPI001E5462DD|nr:histidine kinase [Marinimicrobium alkaliphilum]